MKRNVVLIDGTWNNEGIGFDTNVAKLDPAYGAPAGPLIKPIAQDGVRQLCFYHDGVGSDGPWLRKLLGGAIGLGLKSIIQDAYSWLAKNFEAGDEIYLIGFSRGAYAVRALAGLIGASGIPRNADRAVVEAAWQYYRLKPSVRGGASKPGTGDQKRIIAYRALERGKAFHADRRITCVAVWDTVGSYGVPAGIGLAPLARYVTLALLGFHDTYLGDHIDVGLHAVAIDEHRRPFVPTLWTIPKGECPRGHVEQTWFAGSHCNVGGGYPDSGLSDDAFTWLLARIQALTKLEFGEAEVENRLHPNLDGAVVDSTKGWPIDHRWPHYRTVLSPDAIDHRAFSNSANAKDENINERVHWSAARKVGRPDNADTPYAPPNLHLPIAAGQIADATPEEEAVWRQRR
ncbi:MAG: DUF2235 domain-containing protein [Hyphomicrobiales bacterium]|nr:DUF2235 domain-containing protein [Hyphomicrobiales bacterium]